MPTNLYRARWADQAINVFRDATGCDHEDSLGDLLTDLLHWADASNFDFEAALDRARHHYDAEIAEEAKAAAAVSGRRGVYLHLLHGRTDPDQDMTNWGFTGPILGPFEAVHVTYKEHIRCIAFAAGTELDLGFHEDLLVYAGKYYGDFEVCADHS
jgi:hypothetical protein